MNEQGKEMSKPISRAEMKDWANETWLQCLTKAWNEGKRMNDRELFEMVLDALDSDNPDIQLRTAIALRNRMSQPEPLYSTPDVTPEVTPYVIDCPRCGHCCPQWVGLTNEEIKSLPSWWPSYEDAPALVQLVRDVEAKLREKNEIRNP